MYTCCLSCCTHAAHLYTLRTCQTRTTTTPAATQQAQQLNKGPCQMPCAMQMEDEAKELAVRLFANLQRYTAPVAAARERQEQMLREQLEWEAKVRGEWGCGGGRGGGVITCCSHCGMYLAQQDAEQQEQAG